MTEQEAIKVLEKEKAYMDSHGGDTQSKALDMAINALEKQIAKKPVIIEERGLEVDYKCPVCGLRVIEMRPIENYCRHCGQKLDSEV